jgi:PAS domain S-box-containing protein
MSRPTWFRILGWFWRTGRGRAVLALLVLAGASALALLPVLVLGKEFNQLEQAAIQRDAQRVVDGVQSELRVLGELCKDWAVWDDAHAFVSDRNPTFEKANLGWDSLLASTQIQLIYFLDTRGRIIWGGYHPRDATQAEPLPAFTHERIGELPLLQTSPKEPHSGLLLTPDGPLLLVSQPILHSNSQGPIAGTLLMGRLLDRARLEDLSHLLAIPFQVRDALRTPLEPAEAAAWAARGWEPQIQSRSEARMDLRVALQDLYGTRQLVFTIPWERTIHLQGVRSERFVFTALFLGVLVVTGMLLAAFLRHLQLTRHYHDSLEQAVAQRTSELQEAERRFRAFIDHTHDLMFWCRLREPEGAFVLEGVNPAALRFMGLPLEAVLGKRAHECLPANIAEPIERHIQACAEKSTPLVTEDTMTILGSRRVFQTAFVPVPDERGSVRLIVGSSRDITDLREREETLLRAQKLESLGVLAGGIAHDFNNLLTAAQGNLDICALLMPENTEALPHLENIQAALSKAANLTRQMLAYSGRGQFAIELQDLNVAVKEMVALLEISIGKKASLICELANQLPPMEADGAQIQQVIMNLVTNASDALQGRSGTIRVRTWAETMDGAAIARLPIQFMAPGLHVALEVSDTGSGMTSDIQARIFEPFFSTKGVGRGLGLSAMLGILRSHRGGLLMESTAGRGTTFRLWFPASSGPSEHQTGEETHSQEALLPTGTILLVEDDPEVRNAAGRLVRGMGFSVVEARDGLEALDRFQEHRAEIRLIILDLTMPRMDGREFLAELRKCAPDLPVVVTSGYTIQALPSGDPALTFLQKPYQSTELRATLHKAFGRVHGDR